MEWTQSAANKQPAQFLLLSAWFGLLTGFGEVFLLGIKKLILNRIILLSPQVVWMAPLADVLIFVFIGLILLLLGQRWPSFCSIWSATFIFSFLIFLSLLLMYVPLHPLAALLLAAGLATQNSRLIQAHPKLFHRLFRATIQWTFFLLLALVIGMLTVST